MLANAQLQGADLLGQAIQVATARARSVLGDRVVLRRCDDVEIREPLEETVFEAWCVRKDKSGAVLSVVAIGTDEAGRECVVASGRFTFSTFATPSASLATRLIRLDHRTT